MMRVAIHVCCQKLGNGAEVTFWPSVGEGASVSGMHQVASSICCPEKSLVRVLSASDWVTGSPLFHAGWQSDGSLRKAPCEPGF
jgi:hypothetical protein